MCIPEAEVCDGKSQCRDQSDELDCWKPTKSCEHRCADGKRCIPKKFLCDGERDCLDGTDEVGCGKSSDPFFKYSSTGDEANANYPFKFSLPTILSVCYNF